MFHYTNSSRDETKIERRAKLFFTFFSLFVVFFVCLLYFFLSLRYFLLFWRLVFSRSSSLKSPFLLSLRRHFLSFYLLPSFLFFSLIFLRSSSVSSLFGQSKQHRFSKNSISSIVCLVHVRTPCPGLYRKPRLGLLAARSSARRSRKRARVIQGRSSTTAGLNDSWGASTGPPLFVFLPSCDSSRCFLLYGND